MAVIELLAVLLLLLTAGYFAAHAARGRRRSALAVGIATGMVGLAALFGAVDPREAERLEQVREADEEEEEEDPSGDPP